MALILVSVHDGCEVDFATLNRLLQNGSNPSNPSLVCLCLVRNGHHLDHHSLGRVGRVDDNSIFALLVRDQVGVVVATAHP